MIDPVEIARCFFETFDKSAVADFRRWLAKHPTVDRWVIAADFALRDKSRPNDCFAFSVIPGNENLTTFSDDSVRSLPRDLKNSKSIDDDGIAWIRSDRHFHFAMPMEPDRLIYSNGDGRSQLVVARESLAIGIEKFVELERGDEVVKRFRAAFQKAKANGFNVGLFTDMTLLAFYLALVSLIVCRERKPELIGWMCDRDSMLAYCDGIVWNYTTEDFFGIAEAMDIDVDGVRTEIVDPKPDPEAKKKGIWIDPYIRAADWIGGTLAAWDRKDNKLPGETDKYIRMAENVIADAENLVVLAVYPRAQTLDITRVAVSRTPFKPVGTVDAPEDLVGD